MPFAGKHGYKI